MRNKLIHALAACLLMSVTARAGTNYFGLNANPSGILNITATGDDANAAANAGAWFATNGSPLETGVNAATNGYLQITRGLTNGHRAVIIFDDFDPGLVTAGFTFQCDLRIGAGTTPPADGFSVNYARNSDPVLTGGDFASAPDGEVNLPEEGTQTGLSICFDAWDSGGGDVIGLTIRVDNVIITNVPLPTVNGECADATSAQTGPATNGPAGLCWQPLYVNLTTDGKLSVSWKGVAYLTNFPVPFAPSPGRLVFAGRVGGSNQYTDVDNIRINTIPSSKPIVTSTTGNANGFKFNITDSGFATPDLGTLTVTLDGAAVTPVVTQTAPQGFTITTVVYQDPSLVMAPGSTHSNVIHFTGSTFTGAVDQTNVFTVPNYTLLTEADKAPGTVDTGLPGFFGRIHVLPIKRYPGNDNTIEGLERQLAGGYIDPNTSQPYANLGSVDSFTFDGVINWGQQASVGDPDIGFFRNVGQGTENNADQQIPGTDLGAFDPNHIVAEVVTILQLAPGSYTLGVNADDMVKLTVGADPRDVFARAILTRTGNGSGTATIVVTNAGFYPIRALYGEQGGGAGLEIYTVDFVTGVRVLVNDQANSGLNAYRDTAALSAPYLSSITPWPTHSIPQAGAIVAKFQDGASGTVVDGSITINGQTPTISNNGSETTATLNGPFQIDTNNATLIYSTSLGGPFTNTWGFHVYSALNDVTTAADAVPASITVYQPNGGSSPNNETVTNVLANITQKYLNFGINQAGRPLSEPVGFTVTPGMGTTTVTGLRLYSANDAPERDPKHVVLEGSSDGGASWVPIYSGIVTLPNQRNQGSDDFAGVNRFDYAIAPGERYFTEVQFPNSFGFTSYRWYTDQLKQNANNNVTLMQIAEVELLGVAGGAAPSFLSATLNAGQLTITATQEGTLQAAPGFTGWTNVGPIGPITGPIVVTPTGDFLFYRLQVAP